MLNEKAVVPEIGIDQEYFGIRDVAVQKDLFTDRQDNIRGDPDDPGLGPDRTESFLDPAPETPHVMGIECLCEPVIRIRIEPPAELVALVLLVRTCPETRQFIRILVFLLRHVVGRVSPVAQQPD